MKIENVTTSWMFVSSKMKNVTTSWLLVITKSEYVIASQLLAGSKLENVITTTIFSVHNRTFLTKHYFPLYPQPKTAAVKFQPKFSSIFYDAEENLAAKPLLTHKKTQGKVPWVFNYFYLLSIFCWFFFSRFFFSRFFIFCWCFLFCRLFAFSRSFFRSFFWCCILWSFCRFFLLWHVSSHSAD